MDPVTIAITNHAPIIENGLTVEWVTLHHATTGRELARLQVISGDGVRRHICDADGHAFDGHLSTGEIVDLTVRRALQPRQARIRQRAA